MSRILLRKGAGPLALPLLAVLAVAGAAGCQEQPQQPDFLARVQQDCLAGNRQSCALMDSLTRGAQQAVRPAVDQHRARVLRDTKALLEGMARARASHQEPATPAAPDDSGS